MPLVSHWEATPERVLLLVCPCRSGSTILLRAFGHAGLPAYFQPIKNACRWRYEGQEHPWSPPVCSKDHAIFMKETFGPFHLEETTYDPLSELLATNLSADRIALVVLLRDPAAVWASWRYYWAQRTSYEVFAQAWAACQRSVQRASMARVPAYALSYDDLCRNPAFELSALFAAIGREFPSDALKGWDRKPGFGAAGSGVMLPNEPQAFLTPKAHEPVIRATGIRPMKPAGVITLQERERLSALGVFERYDALSTALPKVAECLKHPLGEKGDE
ncbi:sulfotransferase family protein [Roseobacter denitrificans]|uniref:sulfotransferase family protein n=1 Tax=Roseobacter denitrificans TaxID=2434 RepID=UPI0002FB3640|nr:sulfotransferase family protein [Roseobacter denitrificans]AVL51720.1 sulfotransferase family protein [Roseobacter denitrificans]SFF78944.1 hypothetical protein SAMN05443635_102188 [Roseobacter denitrificans OCh 114]